MAASLHLSPEAIRLIGRYAEKNLSELDNAIVVCRGDKTLIAMLSSSRTTLLYVELPGKACHGRGRYIISKEDILRAVEERARRIDLKRESTIYATFDMIDNLMEKTRRKGYARVRIGDPKALAQLIRESAREYSTLINVAIHKGEPLIGINNLYARMSDCICDGRLVEGGGGPYFVSMESLNLAALPLRELLAGARRVDILVPPSSDGEPSGPGIIEVDTRWGYVKVFIAPSIESFKPSEVELLEPARPGELALNPEQARILQVLYEKIRATWYLVLNRGRAWILGLSGDIAVLVELGSSMGNEGVYSLFRDDNPANLLRLVKYMKKPVGLWMREQSGDIIEILGMKARKDYSEISLEKAEQLVDKASRPEGAVEVDIVGAFRKLGPSKDEYTILAVAPDGGLYLIAINRYSDKARTLKLGALRGEKPPRPIAFSLDMGIGVIRALWNHGARAWLSTLEMGKYSTYILVVENPESNMKFIMVENMYVKHLAAEALREAGRGATGAGIPVPAGDRRSKRPGRGRTEKQGKATRGGRAEPTAAGETSGASTRPARVKEAEEARGMSGGWLGALRELGVEIEGVEEVGTGAARLRAALVRDARGYRYRILLGEPPADLRAWIVELCGSRGCITAYALPARTRRKRATKASG